MWRAAHRENYSSPSCPRGMPASSSGHYEKSGEKKREKEIENYTERKDEGEPIGRRSMETQVVDAIFNLISVHLNSQLK